MQPGEIFARNWRIIRFIGEGGMGSVFEVEHVKNQGRRALKLMHQFIPLRDPRAIERFNREAMVGAKLSNLGSRHVADVFDNGVENGTPWLVMELLRGETLDGLLTREGALSPGRVASLFGQICDGLARAHAMNVVHRDLKPENIFLHDSGNEDVTVKLIDFGIAKLVDDGTGRYTQAGTPGWMAPEQAFNADPVRPDQIWRVGPSTDVWSLGLIAYRALTGAEYWEQFPSIHAYFQQILARTFPPPSVRAAQQGRHGCISPAFDAWFARCVAVDPGTRFANAADAWQALAAILGPPERISRLPAGQLAPQAKPSTKPGSSSGSAPYVHGVSAQFGPDVSFAAPVPQAAYPSHAVPQHPHYAPTPPTHPYQTPPPVHYSPVPPQPQGPAHYSYEAAPPAPGQYTPTPHYQTPTTPYPGPHVTAGTGTVLGSPPPEVYQSRPSAPAAVLPSARPSNRPNGAKIAVAASAALLVIGIIGAVALLKPDAERRCAKQSASVTEQNAKEVIDTCRTACDSKGGEACVIQGDLTRRFEKGADAASSAASAYRKGCDSGIASGCRGLGESEEFSNPEAASGHLKQACASGDKLACVEAGALAELGHSQGGAPGVTEAKAAYESACANGNQLGCAYQAFLLAEGRGSARDEARAGEMLKTALPELRKACELDEWRSCVALSAAGQLLRDDAVLVAVPPLLERACAAGFQTACTNQGAGLLLQTASEPGRAVPILRQACEAKEPAACNNLAAIRSGIDFTPRIGTRGATVLKLLCGGGLRVGCADWGKAFSAKAGEIDEAEARTSWQRACEAGELVACVNLGGFSCRGVGRPECDTAAENFRRACDGGNPGGCGELGAMYSSGRRMAPDQAQSKSLMAKACEAGEIDACDRAETSFSKPACEKRRLAFACVSYANALMSGANGTPVDLSRAEELLTDAGKGRNDRPYPRALELLGDLRAKQQRPNDALASYRSGCDQGARGCASVAYTLMKTPGWSREEVHGILDKGCQSGEWDSCVGKAQVDLDRGSAAEKQQALESLATLCREGDQTACVIAADAWASGKGGKRDPVRASGLYKEACDRGVERACKARTVPDSGTASNTSSTQRPTPSDSPQCREVRRLAAQCSSFSGHCEDLVMHKNTLKGSLLTCQNICQLGVKGASRHYHCG